MPDPYPSLPATTPVLIAQAAHRRLAEDEPLQAFAQGGIEEGEIDDLILTETAVSARIMTLVEAYDEDRSGANHQGTLRTTLSHLIILPVHPELSLQGHLRTRVTERIKTAFLQPTEFDPGGVGVLATDGDPPAIVTDYLERFERVSGPVWRRDLNLTVTTVRTVWVTTIDIVTRGFQ